MIPDSIATLDSDSPDQKRQKNIREDLGLGMVVELAGAAAKFGIGIAGTTAGLRKSNKLVGETAEAKKWLEGNSPKPRAETPEDYVIEGAIKQEEALDEVGMYGYSQNPSLDAPIKGIHDAFDYTETVYALSMTLVLSELRLTRCVLHVTLTL